MTTGTKKVRSKTDQEEMYYHLMEAFNLEEPKPMIELLTKMKKVYIEATEILGKECPSLEEFIRRGKFGRHVCTAKVLYDPAAKEYCEFIGIQLHNVSSIQTVPGTIFKLLGHKLMVEAKKRFLKDGDSDKTIYDYDGSTFYVDRLQTTVYIKV